MPGEPHVPGEPPASFSDLLDGGGDDDALVPVVETRISYGNFEVIYSGGVPVGMIGNGREMRWRKRTAGSLGFPQEFYSLFPGLPPRSVFYQTSLTDAYPQYGPYLTQGPGADQDALREQCLAARAARGARDDSASAPEGAEARAHGLLPGCGRARGVETAGLSKAVEKQASEALAALSEFDATADGDVGRCSGEIRALRQRCHEAREKVESALRVKDVATDRIGRNVPLVQAQVSTLDYERAAAYATYMGVQVSSDSSLAFLRRKIEGFFLRREVSVFCTPCCARRRRRSVGGPRGTPADPAHRARSH